MDPGPLHTRIATPADAGAIARIFNEGIEDRTATFETRPRSAADVAGWFDGRHPIVVVEAGGEVIAFAASSQWRAHERFRGIAELAVYVARAARGKGAGKAALGALLEAARAAGFWKLLGACFVENHGSRRVMLSCGLREVGVFQKQALHEGAWMDVAMFERILF
jgi:L-amino acid N-acyltransferase YncA